MWVWTSGSLMVHVSCKSCFLSWLLLKKEEVAVYETFPFVLVIIYSNVLWGERAILYAYVFSSLVCSLRKSHYDWGSCCRCQLGAKELKMRSFFPVTLRHNGPRSNSPKVRRSIFLASPKVGRLLLLSLQLSRRGFQVQVRNTGCKSKKSMLEEDLPSEKLEGNYKHVDSSFLLIIIKSNKCYMSKDFSLPIRYQLLSNYNLRFFHLHPVVVKWKQD